MARRGGRAAIAFMAVWLAVWTAMILVVLWLIGGALVAGDLGAAPFLLIWLGFAGLGLYAGVRRLQTLVGLVPPAAPPAGRKDHVWTDDARPDAPGGPRDG